MELPSSEVFLEAQKYARPIAIRILRDMDAVEDALQGAALQAIKNISKFRQDCAFNSWFARITINESLMHLRRHKRDIFSTPFDEVNEEELAFRLHPIAPDPFEQASYNELHNFVLKEIVRMPPFVQKGANRILGDEPAGNRTNRARAHRCRMLLKKAIAQKLSRPQKPAVLTDSALLPQ